MSCRQLIVAVPPWRRSRADWTPSLRAGGCGRMVPALGLFILLLVAVGAEARVETLRWRAGAGGDAAEGFIVYAGPSQGSYSFAQDVGDAGGADGDGIYSYTWDLTGSTLDEVDLYVSVQAYDAQGEVSEFSNWSLREGATAPEPEPAPNQAPNGTISSPAPTVSITAGNSVVFAATGSDPDGDDLAYVWDFDVSGVGSRNVQNPGSIRFDQAGSFIVTLTVTDREGLADPTPDTVSITVVPVSVPDPDPDPDPEPDPDPTPDPDPIPGPGVVTVGASTVVSGIGTASFVTAPAGDPRLFVVQQVGRVRIVEGGAVRPADFIDLRDDTATGEGQGLLGLAFDPAYAENGYFYTSRTDAQGTLVISRFETSSDPYLSEALSERVILEVPQPYSDDNGGHIAFGPDGFLYIALGDGGGHADPANQSQAADKLHGKLLRIDVADTLAAGSVPVPGARYAIPANNPYLGNGSVRDEIWSFGLHDPRRFSFDRLNGDLWIADRGENVASEIDYEPFDSAGGVNYGWDVVEGTRCNDDDPSPALSCNSAEITDPVYEYPHNDFVCGIIGGHIYRGVQPELKGRYFFTDSCSGRVWSRHAGSGDVVNHTASIEAAIKSPLKAVGFGEDAVGELYVIGDDGRIHKLRGAEQECADGYDNDGDGYADFGADAGCLSLGSAFENPICNDGIDNDGDGAVDLEDGECRHAYENVEAAALPGGGDSAAESFCGLGAEIVLLAPAFMVARRRLSRHRRA